MAVTVSPMWAGRRQAAAPGSAPAAGPGGLTPQQQQQQLQPYVQTAVNDLNSGNYAGAWQAAADSGRLYNTNYDSITKDPLLQAMESGTGLQALDPTKKWDANSMRAYYDAFNSNPITHGQQTGAMAGESWGKNPYGTWGDMHDIPGQVQANLAAQGDNSAPDIQRFLGARPKQSFLGKYGTDIAMLAAAVIAPEAIPELAAAMGGGTAATIGAGALFGAGSTAAGDLLGGKPITGRGLLGGAAGGAIGSSGLSNALGGGVLGGAASGALGGAVRGGISGTGIGQGALMGGIGGGISAGVSGGAGQMGLGQGISGALGGLAANAAKGAIGGSGNNMATGSQSLSGFGGVASGLAGLVGAGLGAAANNKISNQQTNAYTTAGNAANTNPWNTSGPGGIGATFNNGQIGLNAGAMGPAASQFGQFASQQLGQGMNGVPAGVTNSGNAFMQQLQRLMGSSQMGANGASSIMNSPLVGNSLGAAQGLENSAGANFGTAYNTALQSQLAALNPAIQQQSNALLNSQFERGQAGTSGGALQTQALQNSFNQANLSAQNNALGQANAIMGTTGNLANTFAGIGNSTFGTGAGALGSFNNQGAQFGQAGVNTQQQLAAFAPQLAGMYGANANGAVSGFGGINNALLGQGTLGLNVGANQGNQMNKAAGVQAMIGLNPNNTGGQNSTYAQLANSFSSLFNGGAAGGANPYGGLLQSIFGGFGGGGGSNPGGSSYTGGYDQAAAGTAGQTFDTTGANTFTPTDTGNTTYWGP